MKKLQKFTTPDQSKRLLDLGLPANSADCYIYGYGCKWETPLLIIQGDVKADIFQNSNYLPCWSVGLLIEIYMIAAGLQWIDLCLPDDFTESIVKMFEGTKDLDFSKLED